MFNFLSSFNEPKLCKSWLDEIEKWAIHTVSNDEGKKSALYITAKKTVSDFVSRYLTSNPNCTWAELKKQVLEKFSHICDPSHALDELSNIKQKKANHFLFT